MVSTALGLGLPSWSLFVLGLVEFFYPATVLVLAATVHVWGFRACGA